MYGMNRILTLLVISLLATACTKRFDIKRGEEAIKKNRYIKHVLEKEDSDSCKFDAKDSIIKAVKGKIDYTERLNLDLGSEDEEKSDSDEVIGRYNNKKQTRRAKKHNEDDEQDDNVNNSKVKDKYKADDMDDDDDWECVVYRKKDYK